MAVDVVYKDALGRKDNDGNSYISYFFQTCGITGFNSHEENLMSDVYIMGVDMIKFGRFPEKTVPQIGAQAALMALDDAGLSIKDMQALYCGNLGQSSGMVGQRILQEIGQTGIGVVNCANACATGAPHFVKPGCLSKQV
jgi:hypothetical protein